MTDVNAIRSRLSEVRHAGCEDDIASLLTIIDDAIEALGPVWMHGDATLAEGIRRKTAAMERLAMPPERKRPGATLTVERGDGSTETTTYGGDR